jgi:UDP-N-acetylmuramyl pentapeptide phosphotransferase/UDP-N-acetylglucosamine-1-phosphate transferase
MIDSSNAWHAIGFLGPGIVLAALAASAGLIVLLKPLFGRFALAVPTARSSHRALTPQWGGLAVVVAALGIAGLVLSVSPQFGTEAVTRTYQVLLAALLLVSVGVVDDMRHLTPAPKFLAQTIAVALVVAALPEGLRIVPALPWWVERGMMLVAGVWFVNVINFMDGIDWMVVAEVVPVTAGLAIIGALGALPPEGLVVALALNGAMLGFAPFNRPVAQLFLGDMGSLPTGLLLAWLLFLLAGSGHVAAALLLPLYFAADATVTLLRRLLAGERVWEAHRTHYYQRAGDGGWSNMEIVARVFAVNLGLVALAVASVVANSPAADTVAVALGAGLVVWLMTGFARGKQ